MPAISLLRYRIPLTGVRIASVLLAWALSACSSENTATPTVQPTTPVAIVSPTAIGSPAPTQPATATPNLPTLSAPPSPCAASNTVNTQQNAPGAAQESEQSMQLRYDQKTNTIELQRGKDVTFAMIEQELGTTDVLRETAPGEWLLAANLQIKKDANLRIAAPEVRRLKLQSTPREFVSIKVLGGTLRLEGVCATSWDSEANAVDTNYDDGRSFVLARDGATMNIRQSELSYLGYDANESYGLAYRLAGTSGEVVESTLGYNFYGLYTFEVSDLVIRGNEVHHSVLYGIDPHTNSRRLQIEQNLSHHNGKHGIILAEGCSDSVIRGNETFNNELHGIVLYNDSDNNIVEGNRSYNNKLEGINVNNSSNNQIQNNTLYGNQESGIGIGQTAQKNIVDANSSYDNQVDGIAIYSDATKNELRNNRITDNVRYGIYIKSDANVIQGGNEITGNKIGVYLNVKNPPDVSLDANQINQNAEDNVRIKLP